MSYKSIGERHLSETTLRQLKTGSIQGQEKLFVMEHIAGCEMCAGRLAECFAEEELLSLPPQFEEGVAKKLSQIRVTVTPLSLVRQETRPHTQRELRRYSCRVAVAACLALFLIFSGTFTMGMDAISKSRVLNPDLSVVNRITQGISEFTEDIIQWEVNDNDKEKK